MTKPSIAAKRGRARSRIRAMVLALAVAPAAAWPSCFPELTGGDEPFSHLLTTNAKAAIAPLLAALEAQRHSPGPQSPAQPSVAHLYAMLMDAYDDSGDIERAAEASRQGLANLTSTDSDALRRRLQMTGLVIEDEQGQILDSNAQADKLFTQLPADAPDLFCLLLDRGHLRKRAGRKVDATTDLMQAFRIAQDLHSDNLRIQTGLRLASIYSQYQLFDEAHALEDEAIRYYQSKGDNDGLGMTHLYQGSDYLDQGNFAEAEAQLLKAKSYYRSLGSLGDEAVAQVLLCETLTRQPHRSDARSVCSEAAYDAGATQYPEGVKLVHGSLGELELLQGHPAAAMDLLNRALAPDRVQITAQMRAYFLHLRGRARAALHDLSGALDDTNQYIDWLKADHESTEADKVAVLRVRFESALNEQELQKAQALASVAQSRAEREALLRNGVVVSAVGFIGIMILIGLLWRRVDILRSRRATDERLAAVGRLAGGVAHEFNNQLTVMQQALGQLNRLTADTANPRIRDLVDVLQSSVHASADITAQLQSFGRQQNLRPKVVGLQEFFRALAPMLEKAKGSRSTIEISVDMPEPRAWTDDRLLSSAILNLVLNSRDAMPQGGQIRIHAAYDDDKRVRIDVADNGVGMSDDVLQHAVDPFYSTKEVGTGAGLGLSMVSGFVTQSGGSMQIRSQLHSGTTVSIWIPSARGQDDPHAGYRG